MIAFFRPATGAGASCLRYAPPSGCGGGQHRWRSPRCSSSTRCRSSSSACQRQLPADTPNLRIVTANVLFNNATPSVSARSSPSCPPISSSRRKPGTTGRTCFEACRGYHLVGQEELKWNSNLVLGRYPMRASLVTDMPPSGNWLGGGPALRVEVDLPGRAKPLVVYADPFADAALAGRLGGTQPLSRRARRAYRRRTGRYRDRARGRHGTHRSGRRPMPARSSCRGWRRPKRSAWPSASRIFASLGGVNVGTPIDHVVVSRGIGVADLFTGPAFNSDHLPVVADLKLP